MAGSFQVFISHFTGERNIAEAFQTFFQDAFPSLGVFRSSDAESIPTGEGQYQAIVSALKTADVMIVLLSADSVRRPWVPFESGFALGRGASVFTFLVRQATPADIPSPFAEMLLRTADEIEVEKALLAVEKRLGVAREPVSIKRLLRDIGEAERLVPRMRLDLEPYVASDNNPTLYFRLWYQGYKPLRLQSIEVGIPKDIKDPHWPALQVVGHLRVDIRVVNGLTYVFKRYIANTAAPSPFSGGHDFRVLAPILHSSEEPRDLVELRFPLNREINPYEDRFLIRWRIETAEFETEESVIPMSTVQR